MRITSHPRIAHRLLQELQRVIPPGQPDTVILAESAIISAHRHRGECSDARVENEMRQGNGSKEGSSNRTAESSKYLVPDPVLFDLILEGPETDTQQFGSLLSMIRDFC
jgi:hypothetical protein